MDTPIRLQVAPRWMLTAAGWFSPMLREVAEMLYQFEAPFVVEHRKFESTFGSHVTPHEEAIRMTAAWYRANHGGN
ncbi:hypothetical protein D3C72_1999890 [compost metagenome]